MRQRLRSTRAQLLDEDALRRTLERLAAEGRLSGDGASRARAELDAVREDSVYVLRHLGAHLAIGGLRATLPFLPLGSLLRGGWVLAWRLREEVRGDRVRARVHSGRVLLIALVPFAGYLAYLVPLRSLHPTAAWIYANHVSFLRSGRSLERSLEGKPRPLRRLVGWLAPAPAAR